MKNRVEIKFLIPENHHALSKNRETKISETSDEWMLMEERLCYTLLHYTKRFL